MEEAKQARLVFTDPSKRTFVPEDVAVEETLELILDRTVAVYTETQVRALAGNRKSMPAPERLAGSVTVTAPKGDWRRRGDPLLLRGARASSQGEAAIQGGGLAGEDRLRGVVAVQGAARGRSSSSGTAWRRSCGAPCTL